MSVLARRLRWHRALRVQTRGARPAVGVVLLYHRIAGGFDPLALGVTPERFAEHLDVVRSLGTPASLHEIAEATRPGPRPLVGVTFDDGYDDNLRVAEPVLASAGVPATVFVATGPVDGTGELWWDALARHVLTDEARAADPRWTIESPDDPTPAHAAYRSAFLRLRHMPSRERDIALASIRSASTAATPVEHPVLAPDAVGALARSAVVTVGGHTVSHPVLSSLPSVEQRREVAEGRRRLEELTDTSVTSFAYPFGTPLEYDRRSVAAVRAAGFTVGCANVCFPVGPGSPRLEIPRLVVRDWTAEELERRLLALLRGGRAS